VKRTVASAPHLRRVGFVVAVAALVVIGFATLSPQAGTVSGSHLCLRCGPLGGVNSLLNVFLFMPLGLGLAFSGFSGKRTVFVACALSALIELAQLLVIPGRYATIGDVITNTAGGALGFAVGRYWFTLLRPSRRIALPLSVCWCGIWLVIQVLGSYGFYPSIPRAAYYGELGPSLGDFEDFKGRVLSASIGNVVVANAPFPTNDGLRELLLHGATLRSTIVLPDPIAGVAPIVRITDASESELLLLAQDSADLIFGVRTGAAVLRLRPPIFALRDVMSANKMRDRLPMTDTVAVAARYSAHEALLRTQSTASHDIARASHGDRIAITASLAWTLLMPFQWLIGGTGLESAVSFAWLAILLFPLGYWGAAVVRNRRPAEADGLTIAAALIGVTALYLGLSGVPHAFGLAPSPLRDWIAASIGIVSGGATYLQQRAGKETATMEVHERHFA
jgi:hypothetical protein